MTLGEKQRLFVYLQGVFILWCYANDYELSDGEAHRPPELSALYAKQGRGISNSLHGIRLARDWNLFKDLSLPGDEDIYQKDSEAYRPLGDFWKSLHPLCRWGGDFSTKDGNHFSLEHEGVK